MAEKEVDISGFLLALWYLEQAVRVANEAKRLAIQSHVFADLTQKIAEIYKVSE